MCFVIAAALTCAPVGVAWSTPVENGTAVQEIVLPLCRIKPAQAN